MSDSLRGVSDIVKPDPARGTLGDANYARHWAESHENIADMEAYCASLADVLLLDSLLPDGYRLLDVGCGTGGYHRLLSDRGHVHGIDPIPEMIVEAERFAREAGLSGASYQRATFEDFAADGLFDAVRMVGIYGWYLPWHGRQGALDRVRDLLVPGGIALLSFVPAIGLTRQLKVALAPGRTVVIPERRFVRMARRAGLAPMFSLRQPHVDLMFLRKGD